VEKAISPHPLLESVREACSAARVSFKEAKKLLENFVDTDTIIDYYISQGPFPARQDVLLDIFVLSPSCLYNIDMRTSVSLCHRLFLAQMSLIESKVEVEEDGEYYIVYCFFVGTHDIILREKVSNRYNAEKFCSKVKDAVVAIQQFKS